MTCSRPNGFVELEELVQREGAREQWEETARWVTLEENVESDRWSKPHIPCLSLQGLQNVRNVLAVCPMLIDIEETDMSSIVDVVVSEVIRCGNLDEKFRDSIVRLLLLNHHHKDQSRATLLARRLNRHFSMVEDQEGGKSNAQVDGIFDEVETLQRSRRKSLCCYVCIPMCPRKNPNEVNPQDQVVPSDNAGTKREQDISELQLPEASESTTVLVGTVNFLEKPISVFVRLREACFLGNLIEVNVPVRFLFVLLGPEDEQNKYKETGRSMAAMMSEKTFLSQAYQFKERSVLLRTIDDFLDDCVVIPPGEWDRQVLMQTIPVIESQSKKMYQVRQRKNTGVVQEDIDMVQEPTEDPLKRTGYFCGGLVKDIKRRYPNYVSDLTDAFDIHCLAAIVFVYIASLAPAITFGGILSEKTGGWIGVSETILATAFGGVFFALLAGQPLTIISLTGPVVVFEKNTYVLSESLGIEYLPFRAWIGMWVMMICFVTVACEGCFFIRYFTRFTEEIFACLIAFTFISDAVLIVIKEYDSSSTVNKVTSLTNCSNVTVSSSSSSTSSRASGHLAMLLLIGTFLVSYMFRRFRHSHIFNHLMRRIMSDFGVLIAILSMVWYYSLDDGVSVSQLKVPNGFEMSKSERKSWFVNPMGTNNSMGALSIICAFVPAVLVSILIFMEVELTGLILDKKEFKMKKGTGYNLDLLVVGMIVGIGSLFGFPWMCASPIHSVSHLQALMVFNHRQAPGQRPQLVEVKEQRVTNIIIHILIGISAALAPVLRSIPIAVLAGVLLYLGISSLSHIQFCERVKMLIQTPNHHPDVPYVLRVKTRKMHAFTLIQLVCVCVIILIKLTPMAPAFPFFVLCLIPLRKSLSYWFEESELELLDNDEEEHNEEEFDEFDAVHVPI